MTGEDLNRRWQSPNEVIHPEIFHTKGLLSYVNTVMNKDTFLFCDFHGHSRFHLMISLHVYLTSDLDFESNFISGRKMFSFMAVHQTKVGGAQIGNLKMTLELTWYILILILALIQMLEGF